MGREGREKRERKKLSGAEELQERAKEGKARWGRNRLL